MADNNSMKRAAEILGSIDRHKKEAQVKSQREEKDFIAAVAAHTIDALKPALNAIASQARIAKADMEAMVSKISVTTHTPDVIIPNIAVPKAEVTVRSPKIVIPDIKMPDKMNIQGFVSLMGIDLGNPLPVQLRTADGKPFMFPSMSSGGGGKADFFTVKGFSQSAFSELTNDDGRLRVSVETGGSGLTDSELRATSVPVSQVSGVAWSTEVTSIFGSTVTSDVINADNRLRVSVETGGSGLTDAELRATSVPVEQVSGSSWSTNVLSTVGLTDTELRATPVPISAGSTLEVIQVSGATSSVNVLSTVGLTDTELRASTLDVKQVSGAISSVSVTNVPTVRPIQVRGSLGTAYTSLATGTETTLLTAEAGTFHDLVWVLGANQSDVAVLVDIRMVTAGHVVMSLEIPANSTAGIAPPIPYPQSDSGNNWTVDMADITGTTVDITALFSKE